jgi:hypothetical protein
MCTSTVKITWKTKTVRWKASFIRDVFFGDENTFRNHALAEKYNKTHVRCAQMQNTDTCVPTLTPNSKRNRKIGEAYKHYSFIRNKIYKKVWKIHVYIFCKG